MARTTLKEMAHYKLEKILRRLLENMHNFTSCSKFVR